MNEELIRKYLPDENLCDIHKTSKAQKKGSAQPRYVGRVSRKIDYKRIKFFFLYAADIKAYLIWDVRKEAKKRECFSIIRNDVLEALESGCSPRKGVEFRFRKMESVNVVPENKLEEFLTKMK